jgi:hypothetical protein
MQDGEEIPIRAFFLNAERIQSPKLDENHPGKICDAVGEYDEALILFVKVTRASKNAP